MDKIERLGSKIILCELKIQNIQRGGKCTNTIEELQAQMKIHKKELESKLQ